MKKLKNNICRVAVEQATTCDRLAGNLLYSKLAVNL